MPDVDDLQPLDVLLARREGEEPIPLQSAWIDGEPTTLRATLQRTCVVGGDDPETRSVVRHERVHVNPRTLRWRSKPDPDGRRRAAARGREKRNAERKGRAQPRVVRSATEAAQASNLSTREREVVEALASGEPVAVLAARMGVAEATVRVLLHTARHKAGDVSGAA